MRLTCLEAWASEVVAWEVVVVLVVLSLILLDWLAPDACSSPLCGGGEGERTTHWI